MPAPIDIDLRRDPDETTPVEQPPRSRGLRTLLIVVGVLVVAGLILEILRSDPPERNSASPTRSTVVTTTTVVADDLAEIDEPTGSARAARPGRPLFGFGSTNYPIPPAVEPLLPTDRHALMAYTIDRQLVSIALDTGAVTQLAGIEGRRFRGRLAVGDGAAGFFLQSGDGVAVDSEGNIASLPIPESQGPLLMRGVGPDDGAVWQLAADRSVLVALDGTVLADAPPIPGYIGAVGSTSSGIVVSAPDGGFHLFDPRTGERTGEIRAQVMAAAGDRWFGLLCSDPVTCELVGAEIGSDPVAVRWEEDSPPSRVAISPDGRYIALARARAGTIQIGVYDLATGEPTRFENRDHSRVSQIRWASDSQGLVASFVDGTVVVWPDGHSGDGFDLGVDPRLVSVNDPILLIPSN